MHHATAEDFHPARLLTHVATRTSADQAADVHLRTGFRERKIRRPETNLYRFAKHLLHKEIEGLLEVGERNIFIHIQSFTLVKKTMRSGTDGFITVHAAGADDPDRRLLFFHHPGLHAAGMGAQQPVRIPMNIKCVLHVPRRMIFRQVEGSEIMPVVFDLGSFSNGESEPAKNLDDPVSHQADRMAGSSDDGVAGQGPVLLVGGWRLAVDCFYFIILSFRQYFKLIQNLSEFFFPVRWNILYFLEKIFYDALGSEEPDAVGFGGIRAVDFGGHDFLPVTVQFFQ